MSFFVDNPELLRAFRAGERDILERIYRDQVRSIERYLHSFCRAAGARELLQPGTLPDLLQEIFARAFSPSARQAYDGVRDYRRYLAAIARNCFIDALRARGREVLKSHEELSLELDDSTPEPDVPYDPRVVAVLSRYLEHLPAALVDVYRQRFVLGRSQDDASAALGLSRRQLRTAEQHLRSGLRRELLLAGLLREGVRMNSNEGTSTKPAVRI